MSTDTVDDIKIDEKIKVEITEPVKHKVLLMNDDQTPMEWVIDILDKIFNHSQEVAEKITLQIHQDGSGVAGIYSYEVAEMKATETVTASREKGFPLNVRIEEE